MVTSFCLSGLSPFPGGWAGREPGGTPAPQRLEPRGEAGQRDVRDMHLEPAWVDNVATIERFGQVGTMAVRGFAPFVAVEDIAAGVTWAAQVAWSGSWQIELCRRGDG